MIISKLFTHSKFTHSLIVFTMKKTILITGSTDGIGKLAAIKLAQDGHEVYAHGRNTEKLEQVISEIKSQTNNDVKGFTADFSDLDSVKKMAQQVKDERAAIDVLINNAGVFNSPQPLNAAGFDLRIVVNYFAPYILTNALIPLLSKSEAPRILNVGSAAQADVSYEVLSGKAQAGTRQTYAQSKLALTMWSFHLAKKLTDVSVIAVNPGSLLNTKMVQEAFGKYWSPAEKGGDILYDLAVSEKYNGMTGKYFDNDAGDFGQAHTDAYDEAKIEKLINATHEILG